MNSVVVVVITCLMLLHTARSAAETSPPATQELQPMSEAPADSIRLEGYDWQQYLTEFFENSDEAAASMEEAYGHLTELVQQPLDINTADIDQLMLIPGLTIDHISDILQYRTRYGRFRSTDELNMIPGIPSDLRRFLQCFVEVADGSSHPWYSRKGLRDALRNTHHSITATASIPTYYRAGDRGATAESSLGSNRYANKYLGDPVAHSLRYSLSIGSSIKLNLNGGKRAAEPFFADRNTMGYDAYAYNLTIKNLGCFRNIIAGTFRAQFGMGLVLNNHFTLGKQAMLSGIGRLTNSFSPHSGTSDSKHLRGIATTVALGRFTLDAFLSHRYIDATLNADSTISTILTSPYHRTATDMAKKNNSSQTTMGAHVAYRLRTKGGLDASLGASFVNTSLSRSINPVFSKADTISDSKLYRRYNATGKRFWNASIDYRLRWKDLTFSGETATGDSRSIATVNALSLRTKGHLTLMALQRFYAYQYYALYGSCFSEGGSVQNESGIYLGAQWKPLKRLSIDAYTDFAYFPWLRYGVSCSSNAWDNSIAATYTPNKRWTLAVRYHVKSKQTDVTLTDAEGSKTKRLLYRTSHRLRLSATLKNHRWDAKSQLEGCLMSSDEQSNGFIVSQSVGCKISPIWSVSASGAWFCTDDYDSRLYTYERGMRYSFGYTSYYGRGIRASMLLRCAPKRWIELNLKAGHTRYFDRNTIGTAERQIFSNNQTDIDLQVKIRL